MHLKRGNNSVQFSNLPADCTEVNGACPGGMITGGCFADFC